MLLQPLSHTTTHHVEFLGSPQGDGPAARIEDEGGHSALPGNCHQLWVASISRRERNRAALFHVCGSHWSDLDVGVDGVGVGVDVVEDESVQTRVSDVNINQHLVLAATTAHLQRHGATQRSKT